MGTLGTLGTFFILPYQFIWMVSHLQRVPQPFNYYILAESGNKYARCPYFRVT